MAYHNIRAI